MTSPDLQLTPISWLLVGCRGVPLELVAVINVCRLFDGTVICRDHDVLVLEFGLEPGLADEVLAKLPRSTITHVWCSRHPSPLAPARPARPPAEILQPNFCST